VQLKLKYLLTAVVLLPVLAFASEHAAEAEGATDIVPRTINFLIFAAILYYLIADKIKAFFRDRTNGIATQLTQIQEKLESVKTRKEEALKEAEEAKQKAKELVEIAKKEAQMLAEKIELSAKEEAEHLKKALEERMEIEEKKMTKEVVAEVIDEMFQSGKISLSNEDFVKIIKKKVA
jgi:F-type H+-transporting ATPase subunit b